MKGCILTTTAYDDLKAIGRYTRKRWGKKQQHNYLQTIDQLFQRLSGNPRIGTPCDHIIPNLKKHTHKSHTIYYEIESKNILIIRILHNSMDVENNLKNI